MARFGGDQQGGEGGRKSDRRLQKLVYSIQGWERWYPWDKEVGTVIGRPGFVGDRSLMGDRHGPVSGAL